MAESVVKSYFPSQVASDIEKIQVDYGLKVAQAAVDNKGMLGWNVWKKNWRNWKL